MRRFALNQRSDPGAASLEYVGSLFVVGLVIVSLIAGATPVGAAIKVEIGPESASPPAVLPSTLPTTLPTPLDPAALQDVAYLVQ